MKRINEKVLKAVAPKLETVEILAVENGYKVLVPRVPSFYGVVFIPTKDGGLANSSNHNEYVFPDFAALTKWLRDNLRHGKPVKAARKRA